MSPPSSNTTIPSSKVSVQVYDSDDPLPDYCKDYARDYSSDSTEHIPPQPFKVSSQLHFSTTIRSTRDIHDVALNVSFLPGKEVHDHNHQEGNNNNNSDNCSNGFRALITCTFLLKCYSVITKALKSLKKKWIFFKWLFIVLNVVIEVCQAIFSQENAQGKLKTPFYLKLNTITSAFCFMISIIESIHEGKKSKVVWQKIGCFCLGWFYYPGRERRLFGRFSLIFGVVSSMVQLFINLVALVMNKNFLKFDILPLLLSFGYLVAAIMVDREGEDMTKCEVHERCLRQCSCCGVEVANRSFESNLIQVNSSWIQVRNQGG